MTWEGVMHLSFCAVNIRRQPLALRHTHTPAIEVQSEALRMLAGEIGTVESNDRVSLILDPDATQEPISLRVFGWGYIEHQAMHLAEQFASHVVEAIMLTIKTVRIY